MINGVTSHINMDIFTKAGSGGIEIYMLVTNATQLMQPLDKGVFEPLKKERYKSVRKNTRENPGKHMDKKNFALKLPETYIAFHKPSIVIRASNGSGIYPGRGSAISMTNLSHPILSVIQMKFMRQGS